MTRRVRNTLLIWLTAAGFLTAITLLLTVTSGERLVLVLFPFMIGTLLLPVVITVTGVHAAFGKGSIQAASLTALLTVCFLLLITTDGKRLPDITTGFICLSPMMILSLSYGMTRLIMRFRRRGHRLLYGSTLAAAFVLCTLMLYLTGAAHSKMAYSMLPEELFFSQPPNDVTDLYIRNDDSILRTKDGTPFTGTIISYEERLNLNFFSKKESGISYYIDGKEFGISGEVLPPGPYSRQYGSYAGTDYWSLDPSLNRTEEQTFLLHHNYESVIRRELSDRNAVCYERSEEQMSTAYESGALPLLTVVYAFPEGLERKDIWFYPNGVVSEIQTTRCGQYGWEYGWENLMFDSLGSVINYDSQESWQGDDFLPSSFSAYETLMSRKSRSGPWIQKVNRMIYVPYPENWVYEIMSDNIFGVYDITSDIVYCYREDGEYLIPITEEEGTYLLDLINSASLRLHLMDDSTSIETFQDQAVHFKLTSQDEGQSMSLYYGEGSILIENGPYYLDTTDEAGDQSTEERRFRENVLPTAESDTSKFELQLKK